MIHTSCGSLMSSFAIDAIIYYVHLNLVSSLGVGMVRRPDTSDTLVYTLNGALHLLSRSTVGALEHLKLAVDESRMLVLATDGLLSAVDEVASNEGVTNVLDGHELDLGVLRSNLLQVLLEVLSMLVWVASDLVIENCKNNRLK